MTKPKMIFINLPVTDVARSTAFYEAIGFTKDERFSNAHASSMQWSDAIVFMLLGHDFFATFAQKPIADEHEKTAHILCLSMDSRAEVDAIVDKAKAAGGTADIGPTDEYGYMYGRNFTDPDGHVFAPMWMDVDAFMAAGGAQQGDADAA
jgi:uncharacterized protein